MTTTPTAATGITGTAATGFGMGNGSGRSPRRAAARTASRVGHPRRRPLRTGAVLTLTGLLGLGLSACGGGGETASSADPTASASASAAGALTAEDVWVKAGDSGMTSAFGHVVNHTDHTVRIVGAESPAAGSVQLHETAQEAGGSSTMREKEDGFTIEPGQSLELSPGGNHVMLMDLRCALLAGDETQLVLRTEGDGQLRVSAPIRDYAGAQEHYDPTAEASADANHGEHEGHGEHDGHAGHGMNSGEPSDGAASALPRCSG